MTTSTLTVTNVDSALMYAAQRVRVFPLNPAVREADGLARCRCHAGKNCSAPGKHPLMSGYLDKATTDETTIKKWFSTHPHRGIGALLKGFLLVDYDPRNGILDPYMWRKHYDSLPATLTTESGRNDGGRHYLYRLPERCDVQTQQVFPVIDGHERHGIELKANAGTVVLPPSVHHKGNRYRWLNDRGPDVQEITMAPKWLINIVRDAIEANRSTRREKENRLLGEAMVTINNDEYLDAEAVTEIITEYTGKKATLSNGEYSTCCPAHDDNNASLKVSDGDKCTLLTCYAGCTKTSVKPVCDAIGIKESQLFRTKEVTVPGEEGAVNEKAPVIITSGRELMTEVLQSHMTQRS